MSNGTVIINSNDLRAFAQHLGQFNSNLASQMSALNGQFQHLGETWRDPAYARFAQEFEQLVINLQRFQGASESVIPQLMSLASRVDDVHHR